MGEYNKKFWFGLMLIKARISEGEFVFHKLCKLSPINGKACSRKPNFFLFNHKIILFVIPFNFSLLFVFSRL